MLSSPWLCEAASFCRPACTWQAAWFNPLAWSSCVLAPTAGQAQKPGPVVAKDLSQWCRCIRAAGAQPAGQAAAGGAIRLPDLGHSVCGLPGCGRGGDQVPAQPRHQQRLLPMLGAQPR